MRINKIRPLALGIIRNGNKILVQLGRDEKKNENFYRLPGGGIEFGETGIEALHREIKEEFNSEIKEVFFLGMFENIFTFNGDPGHEIALVYSAIMTNEDLFSQEKMKIPDSEGNNYAIWEDVAILKKSQLYPSGVDKFI